MTGDALSRGARLDDVSWARSLLFVPGSRPDRFAKAAASGADLVVCDLEDGVGPEQRAGARDSVGEWLRRGGRAVVRCNAADTSAFEADLAAVLGTDGLAGLLVPKAEDPAVLGEISVRVGRNIPVIALIETAVGVLRAPDIAVCGVARLAFGHLDYAADVGCSTDARSLLAVRSLLVMASRAGRLPGPVDGVTAALDDPAAAEADARAAIVLGFTAKLCIHPRQIVAVHRGLAPADHEVEWARKILAAADSGAGRAGGEMVDPPVLARARSILRRAKADERPVT